MPFPSDPAWWYQLHYLAKCTNHAVHYAVLPVSCFFLVLSSKYLPQHPIF
jgi:hypothetical protein